jgi:hypothetical protein
VGCVNEVSTMVLVPLVLTKPLLRSTAVPFHALLPMENLLALAGTILQVQVAGMCTYFGTIAKFSIVGSRTIGNFCSLLVRIFTHDVASWRVVADESVFITAATTSNIRATHSRTLRPNQLSIMAALSNLTIFIAHGVTRLSGEVITLPLVIPKLNSPHEPLYGSRIPIPEENVLPDRILLEIPQGVGFVPQIALTSPISRFQRQIVIPIHLLHVGRLNLSAQIIVLL